MDWKREAADELRNYTNRKAAIENIRDQIADLATEITSIRSASADGSPVAGGSNGRDDALVNNILKRERLEEAIEKTTAYRWKDCALRNFTITMYGLTET